MAPWHNGKVINEHEERSEKNALRRGSLRSSSAYAVCLRRRR